MEFEEKIKKLESIVEKMQKGELSLDASLKQFEEGVKLSRECNEHLSKVENKVKKLLGVDKDNNPKTEDFNPS